MPVQRRMPGTPEVEVFGRIKFRARRQRLAHKTGRQAFFFQPMYNAVVTTKSRLEIARNPEKSGFVRPK